MDFNFWRIWSLLIWVKVASYSIEALIEELVNASSQLTAPALGNPELIKKLHILPAKKRFENAKKELLRRLGKSKE